MNNTEKGCAPSSADVSGDVTGGGGKRVTSGQIQKQKTLVTGRFAVVHSGLVAVGNENKHVAIKTLKRTCNNCCHVFLVVVYF